MSESTGHSISIPPHLSSAQLLLSQYLLALFCSAPLCSASESAGAAVISVSLRKHTCSTIAADRSRACLCLCPASASALPLALPAAPLPYPLHPGVALSHIRYREEITRTLSPLPLQRKQAGNEERQCAPIGPLQRGGALPAHSSPEVINNGIFIRRVTSERQAGHRSVLMLR